MKNRKHIKNMVLIAIGAVLQAVCAWITVPFAVPFTMQTFGVFSLLMILGGRRGTASLVLYTVLGMVGIPVFSGFGAGIGVLFGPTGGYIPGFIATGLIYWFSEMHFKNSLAVKIISLSLGLLVCYLAGTAAYMLWCNTVSGAVTLGTAMAVCVLPYVLPDIAKLAVAVYVSNRISKAVRV